MWAGQRAGARQRWAGASRRGRGRSFNLAMRDHVCGRPDCENEFKNTYQGKKPRCQTCKDLSSNSDSSSEEEQVPGELGEEVHQEVEVGDDEEVGQEGQAE
eukprot:SAG11_NODE_11482_length_758_cov_0.842185_1_plen_101_part_00